MPSTSPELNQTFGESVFARTISDMIRALRAEVTAAKEDPGRSLNLRKGVEVVADATFLYRFEMDVDPPLPAETRVTIELPASAPTRGIIVSIDDFEILIETDEPLVGSLAEAKLSTEPWFIQVALADRLHALLSESVTNAPILSGLLGGITAQLLRHRAPDPFVLSPNASQAAAIVASLDRRLHFVWGPPGTGKTSNVAQTARAMVDAGERVLILAPSNAAVDVATLRIVTAFENSQALANGKLLRIGTPQLSEVREIELLSPEHIVGRQRPELLVRRKVLRAELRELLKRLRSTKGKEITTDASRLNEVRSELASLQAALRDGTASVIRDASVITATLARFVLDRMLWDLRPENTCVDETSMAPFAFVFASAARTLRRLVCFGDFRQLPPVVISQRPEARMWLGRDAFDLSGVKNRVELGVPDDRLSMLDVQYRMSASIADSVSAFAYQNLLKTDASVAARVAVITSSRPFKDDAILLINTAELLPICERDARLPYSRVNYLHAAIVAGLSAAPMAAAVQSAVAIAPYRAQARLLMRLIRGGTIGHRVRAATIHRFQGAEADIVFFDLVDALPESSPSNLTGKDYDVALRLFNVAVSRARGKVVFIYDGRFVANQTGDSISKILLQHLSARGRDVGLEELRSEIRTSQIASLHSWQEAEIAMMSDLQANRSEGAALNIPQSLEPSAEFLAAIAAHAKGAPVAVSCSIDVAERLEEAEIDLRLRPSAMSFVATIGPTAYVGGNTNRSTYARLGVEPKEHILPTPAKSALIELNSQYILELE